MKPGRVFVFLAVVVIAGAWLAACGGANSPAQDLRLAAEDLRYDTTSLSAKAGQTVRLTLENKGPLEHSFVVDELGVKLERVPPGQTGSVSFTPRAAGTYAYYCDVPGHKEAGMTGTLTVMP